ncbi:MAG: RluA family pseudouridine synthase [Pseudomonadota bacterium]
MSAPLEYRLKVAARGTAPDLLHPATGLSKSEIKRAMRNGAVWLERDGKRSRLRRANRKLQIDDALAIYYSAEVQHSTPPAPKLLEDLESYTVWFKPAGLLSSGSRYGDHHSIGRWVEQHLERPTHVVHRLDRFTRGLMLLAHDKKTADQLAAQFRQRTTDKTYQAEVVGHLADNITINLPIDEREATSHVRPVTRRAARTLVAVTIETGRKHQIRKHLAHIGHPVVGDRLHGDAADGNLQLVATVLAILCPLTGERRRFEIPEDLRLF